MIKMERSDAICHKNVPPVEGRFYQLPVIFPTQFLLNPLLRRLLPLLVSKLRYNNNRNGAKRKKKTINFHLQIEKGSINVRRACSERKSTCQQRYTHKIINDTANPLTAHIH